MLHMDFASQLVINTQAMPWQPSPMVGVERKPLARENIESGHATSIVRYAPNSHFHSHSHPKGEEILVLKGVFSDEHGDYPAGTYLRNPPGTSHAPYSQDGCELFVKLCQFFPGDTATVKIDTNANTWLRGQGGLQVMPLHHFQSDYGNENCALVKWPVGERFQPHRHFGGEEIYVISGTFMDEHGAYPQGSWLRSPHMSEHHPFVKEETLIWVKTGHLYLDI